MGGVLSVYDMSFARVSFKIKLIKMLAWLEKGHGVFANSWACTVIWWLLQKEESFLFGLHTQKYSGHTHRTQEQRERKKEKKRENM